MDLSLDLPALDADRSLVNNSFADKMYTSLSNQLIPVSACPQQVCKPEH